MVEHLNLNTAGEQQAENVPANHVPAIVKFSTEGLDYYDVPGFNGYLEKYNIKPGQIIDTLIEDGLLIAEHNDFNIEDAARILDAYTHCLPKEAKVYLAEKLSFPTQDPDDFLKNLKFLNMTIHYLIQTLELGGETTKINLDVAQHDVIWQALEQAADNDTDGSWLLQKYVQALRREFSGQPEGLGSNKENFQLGPQVIGLSQYGFDTESSFWLSLEHELPDAHQGLYATRPEDFDDVAKAIKRSGWKAGTLINQQQYDQLKSFFRRVTRGDVLIHPENPDQPLDRSQREMVEYRELGKPFFRRTIADLVGIESTTDLDLKTQFQLFHHVKDLDPKTAAKVESLAENYGVDGLQAFLSLAHGGPKMGKTIIDLSERYQEFAPELALVFKEYGHIIRQTQELPDSYSKKTLQFVYEKALQLLKQSGSQEDIQGLARQLIFYKAAIVAQGAHYREERQHNKEKHEKPQIEVTLLGQEQLKQWANYMGEANSENRRQFMTAEQLQQRQQRFTETLTDPAVYFYGVVRNNELLAFASFAEQDDGSLLVESLNVNPVLQGDTGIGNDFFAKVISSLGQDYEIKGYVNKANATTLDRYKAMGFQIQDVISKDGIEYFPIVYKRNRQTANSDTQILTGSTKA